MMSAVPYMIFGILLSVLVAGIVYMMLVLVAPAIAHVLVQDKVDFINGQGWYCGNDWEGGGPISLRTGAGHTIGMRMGAATCSGSAIMNVVTAQDLGQATVDSAHFCHTWGAGTQVEAQNHLPHWHGNAVPYMLDVCALVDRVHAGMFIAALAIALVLGVLILKVFVGGGSSVR